MFKIYRLTRSVKAGLDLGTLEEESHVSGSSELGMVKIWKRNSPSLTKTMVRDHLFNTNQWISATHTIYQNEMSADSPRLLFA